MPAIFNGRNNKGSLRNIKVLGDAYADFSENEGDVSNSIVSDIMIKPIKQSEKLDIILKELYAYKYDSKYYSLKDILNQYNISVSFDEIFALGKRLEQEGYIKFLGGHDDVMGSITAEGVTYVEDDSYTFSGKSIITNNYNISISGHNNTVALGNIENNIIKNIAKLSDGERNMADAFNALKEEVKNSSKISENQRTEYLEHILILTDDALKPIDQRMGKSVLKGVFAFLQEGLTSTAHLAEVWHIWGDQIQKFFF